MKEEGKGGKPAEGVLWKFEGRSATHAELGPAFSWERPHAVLCFIFEVVLMSDSSCYASLFSERPGHCHVWIKLILAILETFVSKWLRLLSGWVAVAK